MDPELPHPGVAARRAQHGAEREQRRVSHAGVDPDYIWRMEHFAGLTHAEIHERVREMDPAAMHESADTWVAVADSLSGAATGLHMTVQSALAEALQGQIAEAAAAAARAFVAQAMDVAEVARNAGRRITAAAYGAEAVRRTVPPPASDVTTGAHAATAFPTGIADPAAQRFAEEQYQLAVAALEANYVPIYPPAGSGVPAFEPIRSARDGSEYGSATTLPDPTAPGRPSSATNPAHPTGYDGRSDATSDRESRLPATPTEPTAAVGNSPGPEDQNAPARTDPGTSEPPPHASSQGAAHDDPTTTPSGVAPGPSVLPHSATTPGPTAPLHPTTPGPTPSPPPPATPGPMTPPGSPGTPASPLTPGDPGRGTPGQPTDRTSRAPTRSENPSRGASWLPGLYPPMAARGGGDQDAPRTTPAWLVWNRERELLGDPPPCAPEIIGADIPATRPRTRATDRADGP
ncbi:hypothetical protein [Nocardia sp. CC227C]|uniref:PPE domain-containing protein n=1 Tax=Nocardia sp. CC227C TaxID=3044562 RepID=UPI00278C2E6F|nr:hypothetical protein [Nocardia sp. CC227C]